MTDDGGALVARKTWRTLEPLHGMMYFVPEAAEEYAALGVTGRDGYFASRASPMGAVSAGVVVATFFNFNPELVHDAIPRVWGIVAPEQLVAARLRVVDRAYRRLLGGEVLASTEMERAAELARTAAESAGASIEGRPLGAAHAQLPWPEEPHLALWHAQSVLRECRGDGHVAMLVAHGLSGIDALLTHAAEGAIPAAVLQSTRGWSDASWHDAIESMRSRGWLAKGEPLAFTASGAARRKEIEDGTDGLAAPGYAELGEEACAELRRLARPWSRILSGQLTFPPSESP